MAEPRDAFMLIVAGDAYPTAGTCADCGFDALAAFELHLLSDRGVSTITRRTFCVRCTDTEE